MPLSLAPGPHPSASKKCTSLLRILFVVARRVLNASCFSLTGYLPDPNSRQARIQGSGQVQPRIEGIPGLFAEGRSGGARSGRQAAAEFLHEQVCGPQCVAEEAHSRGA